MHRYNSVPATLTQATVQAAWDSGTAQTLSKCTGCPGYGVAMLGFTYSDKNNTDIGGKFINLN